VLAELDGKSFKMSYMKNLHLALIPSDGKGLRRGTPVYNAVASKLCII